MPKRWVMLLSLMGLAWSWPASVRADDFSDPAIERAIERGKAFLWSQQTLDGGGTLVIDAAAGDRTFARSTRKWIEKTFGDSQLKLLPKLAPLYRQEDKVINEVSYRRATHKRLGNITTPNLYAITKKGKNEYDEDVDRPAVIFSTEDITCGLVGYPSGFVDGYRPKSAYQIMRNILFLAGDVQTED